MSITIEDLVKKYNPVITSGGEYIFSQKLSAEEESFLETQSIKFRAEAKIFDISHEIIEEDVHEEVLDSQAEEIKDTESLDEKVLQSTESKSVEDKQFDETVSEVKEESVRPPIASKAEICDYWSALYNDKDGKTVTCDSVTGNNVFVKIADEEGIKFKYLDTQQGADIICGEEDIPEYEYFDALVKRAKLGGFDVIRVKDGCSQKFHAKLLAACAKNDIEPIGNIPEDFNFEEFKQEVSKIEDNELNEVVDDLKGHPKGIFYKKYLSMLSATAILALNSCNPKSNEDIEKLYKTQDSLKNVTVMLENEISELEVNSIDKRDTLKTTFIGCNGKMEGYSYFDENGKQVFKRTDCEEKKVAKVIIPTTRKKKVVTKKKVTPVKKVIVPKKVVKPITKREKIEEYKKQVLKSDTLHVACGDTILAKNANTLVIADSPVYEADTLYVSPGDTLINVTNPKTVVIGNPVVPVVADTVKITKTDTIEVKDGIYGLIDLHGGLMGGQNGPKESLDGYSHLTAEGVLGAAKILRDSTKIFMEGRATAGVMGNLRGKDLGSLDAQYATYLNEYAASIGAEFKNVTIEATAGRQKLNSLTQKYTEMNFLDQIHYGHDAAYINDVVAVKGVMKDSTGREYEVLLGLSGQTASGEFFAGPGKDGSSNNGFFIASNNKNIFGGENKGVDLGGGASFNDGNVGGYGTIIFHDYKNKFAAEYTYLKRDNPQVVQAISHIASLRKTFGKVDVKLKFVKEDNFFKQVDTYGMSAYYKPFDRKGTKLRNSWKSNLRVGAYADMANGNYDCYKCGSDGKLQYEKTNTYKNKVNAGVSLIYNFGAKRSR